MLMLKLISFADLRYNLELFFDDQTDHYNQGYYFILIFKGGVSSSRTMQSQKKCLHGLIGNSTRIQCWVLNIKEIFLYC